MMLALQKLCVLFIGLSLPGVLFAVNGEVLIPTSDDIVSKNISSARVITCAIVFPLDQVRFSEQQVTECMKSVNIDAVSYVHVIATSSSTGSGVHNLYLSNRRAGAIEAYLTNHYPNIKVHAFGGGENPKFGKMARIFIVENTGKPEDIQPGIQVASAGPPEIIERTTTKYVTKTEFKERAKAGIDLSLESGPARTVFSTDEYNYFAFRLYKNVKMPFVDKIKFGFSHRILQSNDAVDINISSLGAAGLWTLAQVLGHELFLEQALECGVLQANGRSLEWGAVSALGMQKNDYRFSLQAARSKHTSALGIGIGLRL